MSNEYPTMNLVSLHNACVALWKNKHIDVETQIYKVCACWDDGIIFYDEDGNTYYKWFPDGSIVIGTKSSWRRGCF